MSQKDRLSAAYEDVRTDDSNTCWATFSSSAKGVSPEASGDKLEDLMKQFTDSNVLFAFFRLTTGDALSVRTKFAFMTWIGEKGSPMSKARAGPNKRVIQQVITNFAWEGTFSELKELDLKAIETEVRRAGGANYDAQA
ncbi:Oidioi.mRNA.OKI2018_I69.chr2.g4809.t1.cds [Oikopleura dioica]|uniref:Oidioi.mRNA.OKI2018_I69.chr2.g4809.t1.cds n=1 Tax=Oikopleura dioica TaxID=34765 RepID=A0ABN7T7K5_OIKDI|nr:Oidioi.mRNA.OKI2018_I69.chr2.g4809.t1.cds [Oikopleura dioica]